MSDANQGSAQSTTTADQGKSAQAPAADATAASSAAVTTTQTETKTTEAPAKVVPEKYDVKLPDGSFMKPDYVEKLSAFAKEQKLSNEEAQAVMTRENALVGEVVADLQERFKAQTEAWKEDARNDKEIGGDKFAESAELSKRFIDKFAPPEFAQVLNDHGYGNHPGFLKMIARASKAMADDSWVHTKAQGDARTTEEIFYGKPETAG